MKIMKKLKWVRSDRMESQFLRAQYQLHNIARLSHLDSLGLDLREKKVLELGAGIGDHTLYYLYKGCQVVPLEGRQELCDVIKSRLDIDAVKINFETDLEQLSSFRSFDIVHCYGLLYHLSNPGEFLAAVCKTGKLFLLETCVSTDDSPDPISIVTENHTDSTQAISGQGCRPTRKWLFDELKKYYQHVYCPITQPKHPEFPLDLRANIGGDQLTRAVLVASMQALDNIKLNSTVTNIYEH